VVQLYHSYDVEVGENPEGCTMAIGSRISTFMLTQIPTVGPDGMLDFDSWLKSFILMHEPRCLDPHDMIYAFYGLFTPEIQGRISIDYTMPISDLFALMMRVYIETTGNLWLLSSVEISSRYYSAIPTIDIKLPT
jgi:hypothetical protein